MVYTPFHLYLFEAFLCGKTYCFSIINAITLYFFLIFMDRFLTCIIYHATVSCFRIGMQFLFY